MLRSISSNALALALPLLLSPPITLGGNQGSVNAGSSFLSAHNCTHFAPVDLRCGYFAFHSVLGKLVFFCVANVREDVLLSDVALRELRKTARMQRSSVSVQLRSFRFYCSIASANSRLPRLPQHGYMRSPRGCTGLNIRVGPHACPPVYLLLPEVWSPSISGSSCLNSLAANLHLHLSPFGTFSHLVVMTFASFGNSSHTSTIPNASIASSSFFLPVNTFRILIDNEVIFH